MKFLTSLVALGVVLSVGTAFALEVRSVTDPGSVVFAQVVHRHGARTPTSIHGDHKWACGELGCGILTSEGKDMLFNLGQWARERYMLIPGSNATGTAYLENYTFYYPKRIVQRSTDVSRTLQSAAAFLQGLFNRHESSYYPCVNTVPLDTDSLLYVDSIPAAFINHDVHKEKEDETFNSQYLLPTINASTWVLMGQEFHLSTCDSSNTVWVSCFKEVYDIAESYYSSGTLSQFPTVNANYAALQWLTFTRHTQLLVYNPDIHTDRHRGPLGRAIVDELISQFNQYINGSQDAFMREYSTEDTTLCIMTDTLGQKGLQLPQFGDAFWFELLDTATSTSGSSSSSTSIQSYNIRIIHGSPTQEPGPHTYTMNYFNITCLDEHGTPYFGFEGTCPFADFVRYIGTRTGTSSEGLCYLRPDVRTAIHCDKVESTAPKHKCAWYRSMCPEWACPSGSYLSYPLLNCVSI
jgi:hypothetical protein